jgi:MotA/TolQ/ExbB proton channel family
MRLERRARPRVDSRHLLLLKGFLIWMVVGVAVLAAWHYGLLQEVWRSDSTGLSLGITLVFAGAALRGSWHVLRLSRALNHINDVEFYIEQHGSLAFRRGTELPGPHPDFPDGCVAEHVRHLQKKAEISNGHGRLDQGLLLDAFEADLRQGQEFGWFVADLLLSLGLLGTVIGFILMLGPISGLDATDESAIKGALAAMSGGMAVALYTTLAGLVGGMLLKVQGFLLDGAVQELLGRTTRLTEVFVLPAIERTRVLPMIERVRHDAAA